MRTKPKIIVTSRDVTNGERGRRRKQGAGDPPRRRPLATLSLSAVTDIPARNDLIATVPLEASPRRDGRCGSAFMSLTGSSLPEADWPAGDLLYFVILHPRNGQKRRVNDGLSDCT